MPSYEEYKKKLLEEDEMRRAARTERTQREHEEYVAMMLEAAEQWREENREERMKNEQTQEELRRQEYQRVIQRDAYETYDHPNTMENSTATIVWIVVMVISLLFKGGWALCILETIIWWKFITRHKE